MFIKKKHVAIPIYIPFKIRKHPVQCNVFLSRMNFNLIKTGLFTKFCAVPSYRKVKLKLFVIKPKKKHLCCSSVRLRHIIYLDEFCTSGGRLKESTRLNTKSFTFSSILYDVNFRYQFPHTLTVTKRCDYVFPSRLNISGRRLHALVNKK